jgi:hypothetical protein
MKAVGNLVLLVLGLLVVLVSFELTYLPRRLEDSSLRDQAGFSPFMQILSQSSKESLVPRHYILILGDSYAKGFGEWLNSSDPARNLPYHSAHVIHDRLGQDVLSFGRGGVGSIPGFALVPMRWTRALRAYQVEDPMTILAYFYEGNDLNDNLRYLDRHYAGRYDERRILQADYFDDFLGAEVERYVASKRFVDGTLTIPYVYRLIRRLFESRDGPWDPAAPGEVNRVRMAGEDVAIPDGLQAPGLELTAKELEVALFATERALVFLRKRFPEVEIHLVQVPSPISCYEIVSKNVSTRVYDGPDSVFPAEQVRARREFIRRFLSETARSLGMGFVDVRPAILEVSREGIVHGPNDWKHLNESGYTVMGDAIARHLRAATKAPNSAGQKAGPTL